MRKVKFIVITGGVISGLGKGVSLASIGFFFSKFYKTTPIKMDGYLNVDPGTMNPIEHGEVFVLDDGTEVDMDFGHYERFLDISCSGNESITMGKIYNEIRLKERNGEYLGKTVQLIPHVTDLIKEKIKEIISKNNSELVLLEIGGTVGDIENELFIEAVRQLKYEVSNDDIIYIHLSYVPKPFGVNEQKTKPTQQSVKLLQNKGIWPNIILCRTQDMLLEKNKKKIALFANLHSNDVFSAIDVDSIYKIPNEFNSQGLIDNIASKLNLKIPNKEKLTIWNSLIFKKKFDNEITISIAGKYTGLEDSYASIIEALKHCELNLNVNININWIDTRNKINFEDLKNSNGIIVPGGFGSSGIDGKIEIIKFARENNIPFLGICYGLQLAVIEFARNVMGIKDANSLELDENCKNPVVILMDEQKNIVKKGGTMRLGAFKAKLSKGIIYDLYNELNLINNNIVSERHRHRYEVNPLFVNDLINNGLVISGFGVDKDLVEFIELPSKTHPFFVATQAHPELKSKLDLPAPLFLGLVKASIKNSK